MSVSENQGVSLFCPTVEKSFSRWPEVATQKCTFYRLLEEQITGLKCWQDKYCFTSEQYNTIACIPLSEKKKKKNRNLAGRIKIQGVVQNSFQASTN